MKKKIATLLTAAFVILSTTGFALAESLATTAATFPYFHLGCLIVGGLIIVSLKAKYDKMWVSEAMGAFALYTILISLFTNPVIDLVKNIIG